MHISLSLPLEVLCLLLISGNMEKYIFHINSILYFLNVLKPSYIILYIFYVIYMSY